MGILRVTGEQKKELEALLTPEAEHHIDRENVFSLAEYGSFRQYEGLIQFTVRGEEAPVGELLYLYVRPACRKNGVAAQLLMAMEESLIQSGIREATVLLSEDSSGLGEYLEDYGFEMEESDTRLYTFPDFPGASSSVKKAKKKVASLSKLTRRERAELEALLAPEGISFGAENLDEELSCVYRDLKQGAGVILAENRNGRPTILAIKAAGAGKVQISTLLACCVISEIQEKAPRGMELGISDPEAAQLFEKQFEHYLRVQKAIKGTLVIEEPERLSGEREEENAYG